MGVTYRHFPLHPATPVEGLTLEQLFAGSSSNNQAMQANISRLMADEGLPYGPRTMTYNSRRAQELATWAETKPGGPLIHDALFEAYFVNNLNLASIKNLLAITEQIGLPTEEAELVLQTRSFSPAVDADWRHCRKMGITGVPTFVIGGLFVVGAQPYQRLKSLLLSAGVDRRSPI